MVDGWDVLDTLADIEVDHMDAPNEPVVITEVIIHD